MSKLKEKISDIVDAISDAFNMSSNAIEKVIKENKEYLEAELEFADESQEGVEALENYAENETPGLQEIITNLAETYKQIQNARKEKVKNLGDHFINPLNDLLEKFNIKKAELKDVEKAKKSLEKARKKFNKESYKPAEKRNDEKLQKLKAELDEVEQEYSNEEYEAKVATQTFNRKKIDVITKVLKKIVEIQRNFFQEGLNRFLSLEKKVENLSIEEEYKASEKVFQHGEEIEDELAKKPKEIEM